MSIFAFIPQAFALSLQVFLRYLPILAMYILFWVALFLTTSNPWVIGLIGFILGTYGTAFLFVTGIRAGLMSLKATTAPTASGLLDTTTRVLFFHCLLQLLVGIVLMAIVMSAIYFVLFPILAPEAHAWVELVRNAEDPNLIAPMSDAIADQMRLPFMIASIAYTFVIGALLGIFGVPMAAVSANAVQHSPQNDMIFGMGQYFFSQMLLYVIAQAIPLVILALFAPASMLFPTDAALETVGLLIICIGLYGLYSPAISWAGMALGYKLHRDEIARQRKAEAMPEIDYEAERNNLRTLRAQRAVESAGATMYDPRAARMANSGPDTGETSAE